MTEPLPAPIIVICDCSQSTECPQGRIGDTERCRIPLDRKTITNLAAFIGVVQTKKEPAHG